MKQQCPQCGNWVDGIEISKPYIKDEARKDVKDVVGFAAKIGTALDFIPGGKLVGGVVGWGLKGVVDLAADNIQKKSLKFNCSCGGIWNAPLDSGFSDQEVKDLVLFQQTWNYFFENDDEILSSADNLDAFLSEYESIAIITPVPKSELNFLLAFCAYCAIDLDKHYVSVSRKYINKALHDYNDAEYQLFVELVNNKDTGRNTASIVPNAIKFLEELKEDQALLKQEWYWGQLQDAINEETQKYKEEKIQEKRTYLIKNSLFAIPILLFVIYKYMNYDSPVGFWSTLFSWIPIYWTVLLTLGGAYLVVIADCRKVFSRKDEEWQYEYVNQYTSFKWSDLLK